MPNITMKPESSLKEVQEGIRDWYAEKSREFTSTNYEKYKEDQWLRSLVERDYQRFENRLDSERERLHTEFARRLRLDKPKDLARPKSKLLKEALATNALAKPLISANNLPPNKYRWTEPSPLLEPEHFYCISETEEDEEVEEEEEQEGQSPPLEQQNTNENATQKPTLPSLFGGGTSLANLPPAFQPAAFSAPSTSSLTSFSSSPNSSATNLAKMPQFAGFRTSTPVEEGGAPQLTAFNFSVLKPALSATKDLPPAQIPSFSDVKSTGAETSLVADPDAEIFAPNFLNNSRLGQWIQYYAKFNAKLASDVEAFVQDQQQKDLRIQLSRTITDRINISTKKDASNEDLARVLTFFYDLIEGKKFQSWDDSGNLQINLEDAKILNFAMDTICSRYLEQIKWDLDLLDSISLVLASICLKAKDFFRVLCAKVLTSATLMSMSTIKIIDKVLSFGSSLEAATQWIDNERAVFRLFCRIQMALKSPKGCDTLAAYKVQGPELLRLFFAESAELLEQPVLLASPFILGEIVENFLKPLKKHSRDFAASLHSHYFPAIRSRVLDFAWDEHLGAICSTGGLDDRVKMVLRVRNESLICVLDNALFKEEKKTGV